MEKKCIIVILKEAITQSCVQTMVSWPEPRSGHQGYGRRICWLPLSRRSPENWRHMAHVLFPSVLCPQERWAPLLTDRKRGSYWKATSPFPGIQPKKLFLGTVNTMTNASRSLPSGSHHLVEETVNFRTAWRGLRQCAQETMRCVCTW